MPAYQAAQLDGAHGALEEEVLSLGRVEEFLPQPGGAGCGAVALIAWLKYLWNTPSGGMTIFRSWTIGLTSELSR